ncbi:Cof-type HAD-IIB family hydrolase [Paenibacillus yanchengensis]|uniref:Cof-type HAD-IIB family hydrolase n=1 Tax=Paenibacillus yanchengensis TaxID=2035833 RepID=A0ABW4YNJ3_9BACL
MTNQNLLQTLKYNLIALDIDGTLINDQHEITEEMQSTIAALLGAGADVVLCTGRGPTSTIPILNKLSLTGSAIVHNGSVVIEAGTKQVLYENGFSIVELFPFITYCRQHDINFDVNTALQMMIETTTPELTQMYIDYEESPVLCSDLDRLEQQVVKMTVFAEESIISEVEAIWATWDLPEQLQLIRSGEQFLDIQSKTASKGNALEAYAKLKQIDRSQVIAIGNYFNDVSMLQFAGLGVAMGNSPDEVKELADYVTDTNNNDGAAKALRKYVWNE